jgi:hypothetical protein
MSNQQISYQVKKIGAGILASVLDNRTLFRYTIEMDTTQYEATTEVM